MILNDIERAVICGKQEYRTNADFIETINDIDEREFSKAEFIYNLEYGKNKTKEERAIFFEKLIAEN